MGHINFAMILIHLTGCCRSDVDEILLDELLAVQSTVRDYFGWDYQADLTSAIEMGSMMRDSQPYGVPLWALENRNSSMSLLAKRLKSAKKIVIVGASVEEIDVGLLDDEESVIIAADGSVGAVAGYSNLVCVVTDFDGTPHINKVADNGPVFVAHAHGDNYQRWKELLGRWSKLASPPRLILTHQVTEQIEGLENFGGFTDGDRAVCLALALGVNLQDITLVGFSTTKVGKWSGQTNPERKLEKLDWMLKVLEIIGLSNQVTTHASGEL